MSTIEFLTRHTSSSSALMAATDISEGESENLSESSDEDEVRPVRNSIVNEELKDKLVRLNLLAIVEQTGVTPTLKPDDRPIGYFF
jgi:hypothetical protein